MTDRDLTEKIAAGPLMWTGPVDAGRRLERWFQSGPAASATRWWNIQSARTQLAVIAAMVFALVGMVNMTASLGRLASTNVSPAASSALSTSAPLTQESSAPDAGKVWAVRGLWQGTGSRDTEEFVVGEHWRVDWMFSPAQSGALFQVFIYRSDGRVLMNLAANNQKGGTDTSFWVGPGKYFLRVNSAGGDWKLDVQDLH